MCECTPSLKVRYCGKPGCRDTLAIEVERLKALCQEVHDRLFLGVTDNELRALLETAWKAPK